MSLIDPRGSLIASWQWTVYMVTIIAGCFDTQQGNVSLQQYAQLQNWMQDSSVFRIIIDLSMSGSTE
ncbi:hypothetical protein TNCV_2698481 [Trichonephila clavipes]|nr:hypothetical protein TNCV_2698481 [Trichonephila clavipes]